MLHSNSNSGFNRYLKWGGIIALTCAAAWFVVSWGSNVRRKYKTWEAVQKSEEQERTIKAEVAKERGLAREITFRYLIPARGEQVPRIAAGPFEIQDFQGSADTGNVTFTYCDPLVYPREPERKIEVVCKGWKDGPFPLDGEIPRENGRTSPFHAILKKYCRVVFETDSLRWEMVLYKDDPQSSMIKGYTVEPVETIDESGKPQVKTLVHRSLLVSWKVQKTPLP